MRLQIDMPLYKITDEPNIGGFNRLGPSYTSYIIMLRGPRSIYEKGIKKELRKICKGLNKRRIHIMSVQYDSLLDMTTMRITQQGQCRKKLLGEIWAN